MDIESKRRRDFLKLSVLAAGMGGVQALPTMAGEVPAFGATASETIFECVPSGNVVLVKEALGAGGCPAASDLVPRLARIYSERLAIMTRESNDTLASTPDITIRIHEEETPWFELTVRGAESNAARFIIATPTLRERRWERLGMSRYEWVVRAICGPFLTRFPSYFDLSDLEAFAANFGYFHEKSRTGFGALSLSVGSDTTGLKALSALQECAQELDAQFGTPLRSALAIFHGPLSLKIAGQGIHRIYTALPADSGEMINGPFFGFDVYSPGLAGGFLARGGVSVMGVGERVG